MFAKKPPPEPKLPGLPSVLRISGSQIRLASPPAPDAPPAPPKPPLPDGRLESISEQAPAARIAHAIIAQAFREGATQITLTPEEKGLIVRYLKAEEWGETMCIPHHVAPGLGAAFKTLAGLPLWEYRMALEGLILVQYNEEDYDVHVAITPTRSGEKITLRMEAV